ncbi:MAG: hypothetical protein EXX96DRAFT_590217 [Benjaminiella poitrasii]|nr:MAG: hypothetical protein EXX96DRAFT_590217 [Benjaminiella poitrasii]
MFSMSFKKFVKSLIKKSPQSKKSHRDHQKSSLEPAIANTSFSPFLSDSFLIPKKRTKKPIKKIFKSLKNCCRHLFSKKKFPVYYYNYPSWKKECNDFKDYTVCASPSLDTGLPLKEMDDATIEMTFDDVYLTNDEYIRAITASYSAPNLMRISTTSFLTSTVSPSLGEESVAVTVSPIIPKLIPTDTTSRSDSTIRLASPFEEFFSFDAYYRGGCKDVMESSSAPSLMPMNIIFRSGSIISLASPLEETYSFDLSFYEDAKAVSELSLMPTDTTSRSKSNIGIASPIEETNSLDTSSYKDDDMILYRKQLIVQSIIFMLPFSLLFFAI